MRKARALRGEPINARRGVGSAAVTAQRFVSEVVCEDQHDVGPIAGLSPDGGSARGGARPSGAATESGQAQRGGSGLAEETAATERVRHGDTSRFASGARRQCGHIAQKEGMND